MTLSPAAANASIEDNNGASHRTRAAREQFPILSQMIVGPCGKVLVLCQDGRPLADGVVPDLGIIRIAQSDFENVARVMAGLVQQ